MNDVEKQKLGELVKEMNAEDNTEYIRTAKNSVSLHVDIQTIQRLKNENKRLLKDNFDEFTALCQSQCTFMWTHYTNIFNKLLKDEIDIGILTQFVLILKLIEDGKVDQHEGSVMVGKILKELYLDSALKTGDNLDKKYADSKPVQNEGKPISWREFKKWSQPKK